VNGKLLKKGIKGSGRFMDYRLGKMSKRFGQIRNVQKKIDQKEGKKSKLKSGGRKSATSKA